MFARQFARRNLVGPLWSAAMSKIDEMRRQREAQQKARESHEPAPKLAAVIPLRGAAAAEAPKDEEATTGKCTGCGKVRALERGLVTQHQKGLGKMCPGSRKAPV